MPQLDLAKLTDGLSRTWAGYLRDWDRSRPEAARWRIETPTGELLTDRREVVELTVVEQARAHRFDREYGNRERHPLGAAGCPVAVDVAAGHGDSGAHQTCRGNDPVRCQVVERASAHGPPVGTCRIPHNGMLAPGGAAVYRMENLRPTHVGFRLDTYGTVEIGPNNMTESPGCGSGVVTAVTAASLPSLRSRKSSR